MRAVDEFVRVNKIEGNVFMSFDLDEMKKCDTIACGALKAECPEFVLPVLFDNSTTVATMRYSVPSEYVDVAEYMDEFEIEDILSFYDKLLMILDECSDWFLLKSGFCFEEKHVYINVETQEMKLMYIPDASENFNDQDIKHLLISLLEKCNESSGGNIQLQLYKYFYKPKFSISEFRVMLDNYLAASNIKEKKSANAKDEKVEADKPLTSEHEGVEKKEEKPKAESVPEQPKEAPVKEKEEEVSPRTYYAPKANRSQLSQEEIEEMVKSIYSGKTPEDPNAAYDVKSKANVSTGGEVSETEETTYGPSKDFNKNNGNNKKKNLFDNVFPGQGKPQPSGNKPAASSSRHAMLKSISTHARYDLPKQINIVLDGDAFVIGRATRTGESTGANYEFSAEITPISRIHAQIQYTDGAYYIQDLGSSNGTFVNGTKLEANKPVLIEDGDKIAFAIAYSKNSIEYAFVE